MPDQAANIVVASACHDAHSGISLPRYCRVGANGKIFYLLLFFHLHCVAVPFCNSVIFIVFAALPYTSSGLPFFTNIMFSSINTFLLTTICDLNRVFNIIPNQYQWCYVLIFTYRRFPSSSTFSL